MTHSILEYGSAIPALSAQELATLIADTLSDSATGFLALSETI
jgi:hypothetical protein